MNIKDIKFVKTVTNKVGCGIGAAKVALKNASPDILLYGGIAMVVGGTVLACIETIKVKDISEKNSQEVNAIIERAEEIGDNSSTKRDLRKHYVNVAWRYTKLYAPAVIAEAVGVFCVCKSHGIMKETNAKLAALYTSTDMAFNKYRQAIKDKYGDDADFDIFHGTETKQTTVEEVQEDGKKKKKQIGQHVIVTAEEIESLRKIRLDETTSSLINNGRYSKVYLRDALIAQERFANNKFQSEGSVNMRDILIGLGIPLDRIPDCADIVGWSKANGDETVCFNLKQVFYPMDSEGLHLDTCFDLEFNFFGLIYGTRKNSAYC